MRRTCSACSSDSLSDERVVEHGCGLMDARSAFEGGCPKCSRPADDDTLEPVETIARCGECGHWQAPVADAAEREGPISVSFPDLPELGQPLTWLPARLVPKSERRQQFLSSAIVVMVLLAGIAGAVVASPLLETAPTAGPAAADSEWEEYDSIVIFRNDDIQPWYNTDEMRAVDRVFIDEGVPVTLGVIPNPGGELPLADDEETCEYLGSLQEGHPGQFEMALHGYTHQPETDFHGGSEFGGLSPDEQSERLVRGGAMLEECVEPSGTFVPPMNTYDQNTTRVLAEEGYTVVSGGDWFTDEYYDVDEEDDYFRAGGITHVPENQAFEDWDAYDGGEVPFEDTETLTESFDETHAENGVHVQMLHYQYFTTDERLEQLRELIRHMKATDDVGFMTVGQFAGGIENGSIERIDDGWRVLEPIEHTSAETEEDLEDDPTRAAATEDDR